MSDIMVNCGFCDVKFLKSETQVKKTKNNFCSIGCCMGSHRRILCAKKEDRIDQYNKNPKKCTHCNADLERSKRRYKFCSSRCAATETQKLGGHRKWTEEEKKKLSDWAKKQVRAPKIRIKKECVNCKKVFEIYPYRKNQIGCSRRCSFQYIKENGLFKGKCGGYREKGGRGKQGRYKGYYCHSSWELAWVIYNIDHNIGFKRNTEGFPYDFNGRTYKFFPDFIIESTKEYVEIKGYLDDKNKAKMLFFPHALNLIDKDSIKTYIDYAIEKYGYNFISVYEDK
jgi:hypothetical protein